MRRGDIARRAAAAGQRLDGMCGIELLLRAAAPAAGDHLRYLRESGRIECAEFDDLPGRTLILFTAGGVTLLKCQRQLFVGAYGRYQMHGPRRVCP